MAFYRSITIFSSSTLLTVALPARGDPHTTSLGRVPC